MQCYISHSIRSPNTVRLHLKSHRICQKGIQRLTELDYSHVCMEMMEMMELVGAAESVVSLLVMFVYLFKMGSM